MNPFKPVESEWEEIQRKVGNLPSKKEISEVVDDVIDEHEARLRAEKNIYESKTDEELRGIEEAQEDTAAGVDPFLEEFRRKRMEELRERQLREKFTGEVEYIQKIDWEEQVTNVRGNSVVVFLFEDGNEDCVQLLTYLRSIAPRHKDAKFVMIIGKEAIVNYPSRNLPTILVYRDGKVLRTLIGASAFGGKKMNVREVEQVLRGCGAWGEIGVSESAKTYHRMKQEEEEDVEESDEDEDDAYGRRRRGGDRFHMRF
eukprot:TRINITY_DN1247_c0_g1_i5.p1 TRINITY_DN1247_c0_g1~~TRINITY_DN1247_c0_g1_i5.p1  ORF type:complete len:257 (-),score=99.41 TRINITY_DN1247_c0_g1_i5:610-1380(-)